MTKLNVIILLLLSFTQIIPAQFAEVQPPPKGLDNFALCQPQVHYRGVDEPAGQGKGFLAEMPWGDVLGLSVSHYIRPDGPPPVRIDYLNLETGESLASFKRAYGYPGIIEEMATSDGRDDIMMLGPTRAPRGKRLFELDRKPYATYLDAPVWLIYHYPEMEGGYIVLAGEIKRLYNDGFGVKFVNRFSTSGYSGSPLVHAGTGRVLGVMRGNTPDKEHGVLTTFVPAQFFLERNGKNPPRPSLSRAWQADRPDEPVGADDQVLPPLTGDEAAASGAAQGTEKLVREFDGDASRSGEDEAAGEPTLSFEQPSQADEAADSADSSDTDSESDDDDGGVVIDFGD